MSDIVLHGYWRSSASYRLRIALNLKGVAYRQVAHDLRKGEQRHADYLAIAPHALVPAIEHEGKHFIESPALLEWIEARWPSPALVPVGIDDAAVVRAMSSLVTCDIHPLNNLRVLKQISAQFGANDEDLNQWVALWVSQGFSALEIMIEQHGGRFAFGDMPTFADCCLVPQLYNAERFGVDLSLFPHILAAGAAARALPAFAAADPAVQPDADG